MRLWHVCLLGVLPRQQLLSQWRECVCIAKNLAEKGTPNHILVNKILDYGSDEFLIYGEKVVRELFNRGYQVSYESQHKFSEYNKQWRARRKQDLDGKLPKYAEGQEGFSKNIFGGWHNDRYFIQCFHNLEEKYDCGGITEEEYTKILAFAHWYLYTRNVADSDYRNVINMMNLNSINVCQYPV